MPAHYHERHMPHWQPEGAALFITWRLHGSLPKEVTFAAPTGFEGKRFSEVDKILARAATGPLWLSDDRVAAAVYETLLYGDHTLKLYDLRAWVIMPNHIHILIDPHTTLPKITKSVKNFSARQANKILGRTGAFWQDEPYDRWLRDRPVRERIIRYIESNPVAAGLAKAPEDFRWSSAGTGREACPTVKNTCVT